jgi:hypothetical protein
MALAVVSIGCAVALEVHAVELEGGETPHFEEAPAAPCPVVDSLGDATLHYFEFGPQQTSVFQAEHVAPDRQRTRSSGVVGMKRITDLIVSSMRPGCTPIRLVVLVGRADFDPRGDEIEDHVSVRRMLQVRKELVDAVALHRSIAEERGDHSILSVKFTGGGIGTELATPAKTEAMKRANRVVEVRLVQVASTPVETGLDTATGAPPSESEPEPLD